MNILITGASSGIGEAIAIRLARKENFIFITGRSIKRLETIKNKIEKKGAKCAIKIGDVGNTVDVKSIVKEAINKMESISVLIANAGVGMFNNLEDLTDDDYDLQFNTNTKGVFLYLREVLRHFKIEKQGQIIVMSSNLAFEVTARGSIYCATKHAVQAFVGCLRAELKGTQIKVATINPGSVDTPWFSDYSEEPKNHRLDVQEVVDATMLIINQGKRSNIDHILLYPANQ